MCCSFPSSIVQVIPTPLPSPPPHHKNGYILNTPPPTHMANTFIPVRCTTTFKELGGLTKSCYEMSSLMYYVPKTDTSSHTPATTTNHHFLPIICTSHIGFPGTCRLFSTKVAIVAHTHLYFKHQPTTRPASNTAPSSLSHTHIRTTNFTITIYTLQLNYLCVLVENPHSIYRLIFV